MQRVLAVLVVVLFPVACMLNFPDEHWKLEGRVTDANTGLAIGGIRVSTSSGLNAFPSSASTLFADAGADQEGNYVLEDVRRATDAHSSHRNVTVSFADEGGADGGRFQSLRKDVVLIDGETLVLNVALSPE